VAVHSNAAQPQFLDLEKDSGVVGEGNNGSKEEDAGNDMEFTSEDDFRRSQKVNSVASITPLRLKPHSISRLRIPL